jgi:hypothetical protein
MIFVPPLVILEFAPHLHHLLLPLLRLMVCALLDLLLQVLLELLKLLLSLHYGLVTPGSQLHLFKALHCEVKLARFLTISTLLMVSVQLGQKEERGIRVVILVV